LSEDGDDDCADGLMKESKEGIYDGDLVGAWLGKILGLGDAAMDGEDEGFNDGDDVGSAEGAAID
jgi:hypothetical protein